MKKVFLLALVVMIVAFMAASAFAAGVPNVLASGGGIRTGQYHSYDGLVCTDCHTLHATDGNGAPIAKGGWTTAGGGFRALLQKGDYTDMCLSCHTEGKNTSSSADLRIGNTAAGWEAPVVMTVASAGTPPAGKSMPAGDFFWSNSDPKRGHNPAYTEGAVSPSSKSMAADTALGKTPPGGTLSGEEWSCHSCHGMHARFSDGYTAWRQIQRKVNGIVVSGDVTAFGVESMAGDKGLTAAGYEPIKSNSRGDIQGTNYVNKRADTHPLEAADLNLAYADTNKNVYRGGFSSFCSACHGDFHGGNGEVEGTDNAKTHVGGAWVKHPTNVVMDQTVTTRKYGINTYKKAVTNSQGTLPNPTGYDFLYPLVQPDTNFDVASTLAGGTLHNEDRIMCLTCHVAHASPFNNMTRWDAQGHAFVADGTSLVPAPDVNGNGTGVVGGSGTSNGDNIAFGCGKCHQKGGAKAFVKTGF